MSERRFVFDTNVLVSALLLPRSVPREALDLAFRNGQVLVSAPCLAELDAVLSRPKFQKYLSDDLRLEFLAALARDTELVEIEISLQESVDPQDNMFLELAISGRATHLITGDAHLLRLNPFRGVAVVTARQFLEFLTSNASP